jgi:MATE family multidrug resistance protein
MTFRPTQLPQDLAPDETSLRYMMKLAGPMVVTTISFTVMQFVDRLMVSRLGTDALAAILPASVTSFLPGSFAIGVTASVGTFVSQHLGRGEKQQCSSFCWQSVYMGVAYFLVVVAVMWPTAPALFRLMGYPPHIVELEVTYLRIMLYAQVIAVFIWSSGQFFMGIHRPVIVMYAALCGQVVNVAANYVLIFGRFGFPEMKIAGAAWGTFIGMVVAAAIRLAMFLGEPINSEFNTRHTMRPDIRKMLDLLKVGFPAGLELMINVALWGVILMALVVVFGREASAATSAVFSCTSISVMPVVGLRVALTAAVGKAIGAGRKKVAIRQTTICLRIALVYMGLVGLCFLLFRNGIMDAWASDDKAIEQKVIEAGSPMLILAAVYQVFHAARIIYSGALRGAGDTVWLAIVSAAATVLILGLGGWLVVEYLPQIGPIGPWIAATLSVIAVSLANWRRFRSNKWMEIDLFRRRPPAVPVEDEAAVE